MEYKYDLNEENIQEVQQQVIDWVVLTVFNTINLLMFTQSMEWFLRCSLPRHNYMYMRQAGQHTLGLDRLAHNFQFHVIELFSLGAD